MIVFNGLGDDPGAALGLDVELPEQDAVATSITDAPSYTLLIIMAIVAIIVFTEFGTKNTKRDERHARMRKRLVSQSL